MKLWKKLLVWASLSITLQLAVLWFINDIYLENRGKVIEVTRLEEAEKKPFSKTIKQPGNVSDIKISYDCSFLGYISDGDLKIFDLKGNGRDKLIDRGNSPISYYKWLPDRNMVIYAYDEEKYGRRIIGIETYDADTALTRDYPQMTGTGENTDVCGIELSPFTNTVYVIIKTADGSKLLYKYDIVENLSYIGTVKDITAMFHLNNRDGLIFQNNESKIFIMDGNGKVGGAEFGSSNKLVLLGTDINGYAYIGEMDGKKHVAAVSFGKYEESYENEYRKIALKKSVLPENIHINADGRIYIVYDKEKEVFNPKNGLSFGYPGEFLQIAGKYIVSIKDGKLSYTLLS